MNDCQTSFWELSLKAKVIQIWEYYRWQIIIAVFVVFILGSLIKTMVTHTEPVFSVLMVNSWTDNEKASGSLTPFLLENEVDPDQLDVNTSVSLVLDDPMYYQEQTQLLAMLCAREYDVFLSDKPVFEKYAEQNCFRDLSMYLTEEQINHLGDRVYFAEDKDTGEKYPAGIYLSEENSKWLKKSGAYSECYFGILYKDDKNAPLIQQLISYILV